MTRPYQTACLMIFRKQFVGHFGALHTSSVTAVSTSWNPTKNGRMLIMTVPTEAAGGPVADPAEHVGHVCTEGDSPRK